MLINVKSVWDYIVKNRKNLKTSAKLLEATKCIETGRKLWTFELFFPRCILSEQNTHRKFSRNTGSSRAIPVMKMLKTLMMIPFVPLFWGLNKSGMQSAETMSDFKATLAAMLWKAHFWITYLIVYLLSKLGLHKQWTNRLLEPHSYIRQVVTTDDWENYFNLRIHDDAQPEIILLALLIKEQVDHIEATNGFRMVSNKQGLHNAQNWHLPYITQEERQKHRAQPLFLAKISAARCARTSYLTQEGMVPNVERELNTFRKLAEASPIHASPLEHQAYPAVNGETKSRNFQGFIQYRAYYEEREFGKPIEIPNI